MRRLGRSRFEFQMGMVVVVVHFRRWPATPGPALRKPLARRGEIPATCLRKRAREIENDNRKKRRGRFASRAAFTVLNICKHATRYLA